MQWIFHSDRGSQYASDNFRDVLERHGVMASMNRKGNCWDNALMETPFGSLKVERFHGERFQTIRQAEDAVLGWLLWYNRQRMRSTPEISQPRWSSNATGRTNIRWPPHEECSNRSRRLLRDEINL